MMAAAQFRVASLSVLSPGMARVRAASDHDDGTLDSCARGWDDKYLHSSTAHFAATAFQMDNAMNSLQNFRSLLFHKMQSGAASMIRQSGNIVDIAQAICTRSNHVLGFVNQCRVHLLMNGLRRAAIFCGAGLIVGALRVDCNGLCTAIRSHTADEIPGCLLGCAEGQNCLRSLPSHYLVWYRRMHLSYDYPWWHIMQNWNSQWQTLYPRVWSCENLRHCVQLTKNSSRSRSQFSWIHVRQN